MAIPKVAFVLFSDKTRKTISMSQAIAIQDVLDGRVEPLNAAQEAFAMKVEKIYFGPEAKAANGSTSVEPEIEVEDTRLHPGIDQGSYQGLPVNDR